MSLGLQLFIIAADKARQAAQLENEALKARIARAEVELQHAVIAEREACAKVCDVKAMHCEMKAQEALEAGEHDEVIAIRSTAWQISVCAADIRARGEA